MSHFCNLNIDLACSVWTHALKSPLSSSVSLHLTLKYRTVSIVGTASELKPMSVWIPSSPIITDQHWPTLTIADQHQATFGHDFNNQLVWPPLAVWVALRQGKSYQIGTDSQVTNCHHRCLQDWRKCPWSHNLFCTHSPWLPLLSTHNLQYFTLYSTVGQDELWQ